MILVEAVEVPVADTVVRQLSSQAGAMARIRGMDYGVVTPDDLAENGGVTE